jgi:CheY-like chemotaxis protein
MEATRIIREEIATDYAKSIPILALTANAITGMKELFLQNGFQAYIVKPIDVRKLDRAIKRWIHDKLPEEQVSKSAKEENTPVTTNQTAIFSRLSKANIEVAVALTRLDNNPAIYLDILQSYVKNTPALLEILKKPTPETLPEYAITIHGLKGSSRSIGATVLGDLAAELETTAIKGDYQFVSQNNGALITATEKLLWLIREALPQAAPKTQREAPNPYTLQAMLTASENYNTTEMDKAMEELERYSYRRGGELIDWLRREFSKMNFKGISEKLALEMSIIS